MNKGYVGYSESVRSRNAKSNNIYPKSLWTKAKFIEVATEDERFDLIDKIKSTPLYVLREECLFWSEWHHTSSKFNVTDFYAISYELIEALTDEKINKLREKRRIENLANKEKREARRAEREDREYKLSLMEFTSYKQENAYLRALDNGRIKLEDLEEMKRVKEEKRFYTTLYSAIGQLRKYTNFKNSKEFRKALANKEFNLDSLEIEEKDETNLLFLKRNIEKVVC